MMIKTLFLGIAIGVGFLAYQASEAQSADQVLDPRYYPKGMLKRMELNREIPERAPHLLSIAVCDGCSKMAIRCRNEVPSVSSLKRKKIGMYNKSSIEPHLKALTSGYIGKVEMLEIGEMLSVGIFDCIATGGESPNAPRCGGFEDLKYTLVRRAKDNRYVVKSCFGEDLLR